MYAAIFSFYPETMNEFVTQFIDSYPFPHAIVNSVQSYLNALKPTLANQLLPTNSANMSYNFTAFASDLAFELVDLFITKVDIPINQKTCLREIILKEIELDALQKVGEAMKELQLVYQTFMKINAFLTNLRVDSIGYLPSEQCLEALLTQQCEQCKSNIPALCEDVCTSVNIGCLSPIQDGLQSQMEVLWNVSRQLTSLTQNLMEQILRTHQPSILHASDLMTIVRKTMVS